MEMGHLNCSATAKPTKHQMIELATFVSAVRASGSLSASALVSQVQERDGISLGKHKPTVYRAREAVNEVAGEIVQRSVEKIPQLLAEFARLNSGSTAVAERDGDGHVKRAIVIGDVFAAAVEARQNVLGIDCAHSKCPVYSGVQMILVGRDGNLKNTTIAFALVPTEDRDNYAWFLPS
ncbi:hypothetical protein PR003_g11277 [Phytophthora rubi]|nr:hypothetical protein PR003_g11277 [Phytophthora rubi]